MFLRTETELILKSRRVVPGRLLKAGFTFTTRIGPRRRGSCVPAPDADRSPAAQGQTGAAGWGDG